MSLPKTMLLGLIAGATILLGLPIGRLTRPAPALRVILNAIAVGVLVFLLWDVLSSAWEPIHAALGQFHNGDGRLAPAAGYGALFAGGLVTGLLGLVGYERWMARTTPRREAPAANHTVIEYQPTRAPAAGVGVLNHAHADSRLATWTPSRRLALLIAVGIGLHNFAEGLAIGQSSASNQIALATLLVVGFALHNGTEGFGIVAPLATDTGNDGTRNCPSWKFLLMLGTIGGGPTLIGTTIGHAVTSDALSVVFLTLAAGSILYVIIQLINVAARAQRMDLLAVGLLIGLLAGFVTDAIITAAGI